MIVGGYSLHLYCRYSRALDGPGCPNDGQYPMYMGEYGGQSAAACRRVARRDGWVFNRDGEVTCPDCARGRGRRQA